MRVSTVLSGILAAAASANAADPAPKISDSPIGATYVATLPEKAGSTVRGSVNAVSAPDGNGVKFSISMSGLPAEGGPFMYHIHEKAVPEDGNCTATGAHLDPYKAGETPACNADKPETCQVGDLSGKHGNITGTAGSASYIDEFVSLNANDPSFFGKLSIVVHNSTKARLSCANFMPLTNSTMTSSAAASTGTGSPVGSNGTAVSSVIGVATSTVSVTTGQPTPTQADSGSDKLTFAGAGLMAGLVALVL